MAIPAILFLEEPSERRREDRWRVRLGARWLDNSPEGQSLTILDLSTSGFRVETDQLLKVGSCLIVEMPGEVNKICKTVWNAGKLHGAMFSEPLSETELQNLIGPSSVVWPSFANGARVVAIDQLAVPSSEILYVQRIGESEKIPVPIRLRIFAGVSAALSALASVGIWLAFK